MINKQVYVFDIDGTLTASRNPIEPFFEEFFYEWMQDKSVIFITGSDKEKTIEQIGERIWNQADFAMQSCGNHIFQNGKEIYKIDWKPEQDLIQFLEDLLLESEYPIRTSNHIEERIGLLNFCVVGRDCTQKQREEYYHWDFPRGERLAFANQIMTGFPELEASVGGQISIDIHPVGANKGQAKDWILKEYGEKTVIHFFGDKMARGGNDYDLAVLLDKPHKKYSVRNWRDTHKFLKDI